VNCLRAEDWKMRPDGTNVPVSSPPPFPTQALARVLTVFWIASGIVAVLAGLLPGWLAEFVLAAGLVSALLLAVEDVLVRSPLPDAPLDRPPPIPWLRIAVVAMLAPVLGSLFLLAEPSLAAIYALGAALVCVVFGGVLLMAMRDAKFRALRRQAIG
jgi:membrane associated rhomboid family serine protease